MYEQLLIKLKEMGGKATNKALQEALGWDRADYLNARSNALQAREIVLGRGRGGSVLLSGFNEGPTVPEDFVTPQTTSVVSEPVKVHNPFAGLFGNE